MDISRDGITVDISRDGITVVISRDGILKEWDNCGYLYSPSDTWDVPGIATSNLDNTAPLSSSLPSFVPSSFPLSLPPSFLLPSLPPSLLPTWVGEDGPEVAEDCHSEEEVSEEDTTRPQETSGREGGREGGREDLTHYTDIQQCYNPWGFMTFVVKIHDY